MLLFAWLACHPMTPPRDASDIAVGPAQAVLVLRNSEVPVLRVGATTDLQALDDFGGSTIVYGARVLWSEPGRLELGVSEEEATFVEQIVEAAPEVRIIAGRGAIRAPDEEVLAPLEPQPGEAHVIVRGARVPEYEVGDVVDLYAVEGGGITLLVRDVRVARSRPQMLTLAMSDDDATVVEVAYGRPGVWITPNPPVVRRD